MVRGRCASAALAAIIITRAIAVTDARLVSISGLFLVVGRYGVGTTTQKDAFQQMNVARDNDRFTGGPGSTDYPQKYIAWSSAVRQ